MSYYFEAVQKVAAGLCREEKGNGSGIQDAEWMEGVQEARKEVNGFSLQFLQQLSGATSTEAVKVKVQIAAVSCISLSNTIYKLRNDLDSTNKRELQKVNRLDEVQEALVTQITWLREYFPLYWNEEQLLPVWIAEEESAKMRLRIEVIKTSLASANLPDGLISLIVQPTEQSWATPPFACTYRLFSYLQNLYSEIEAAISRINKENGLTILVNLLVHHNYNEESLISYLVKMYREELSNLPLSENPALQWNGLLLSYSQLPASGSALHPHRPSVKEAITSAIQRELAYLQERETALAAIYGSRNSIAIATKKDTVVTTLSVSQLGVLIRLLYDCKIIQHDNQTELLKMIAGALQTTRTINISAESLRVKYYAPEPAAINIVKEHLLHMLNQLKKY